MCSPTRRSLFIGLDKRTRLILVEAAQHEVEAQLELRVGVGLSAVDLGYADELVGDARSQQVADDHGATRPTHAPAHLGESGTKRVPRDSAQQRIRPFLR